MPLINVLVVSEGSVATEKLSVLTLENQNLLVVGQATNCDEALLKVRLTAPDVVVIFAEDHPSANLDICRKIHRRYPRLRLLIFGDGSKLERALHFLDAGAM